MLFHYSQTLWSKCCQFAFANCISIRISTHGFLHWLSPLMALRPNCLMTLELKRVRLDGVNISLVKTAHQVVGLFGGIKKLTLWIKDTLDVTLDDLQLAIQHIVQGLPTLVYFSCIVRSQSTRAVDFRQISSWILSGGLKRPVSFRCKRYLLDFWL